MSAKEQSRDNSTLFLQGGGEMGKLIREHDWASSKLGLPATWPQSLKTTISIILNSKFPMFLFWGDELLCFYNDAYRPSLGNDGKHPAILGLPAVNAWGEIWEFIKPIIDTVLAGGEASWSEDQLLPIYRNGKLEDVYWTFSYSPVTDEAEKIAGVFVTCMETTAKVQAIKTLNISGQNLRNMVRQAPVGMCIVKGKPLMVEEVNDAFLAIVGKQREAFVTTPYWVVIAEAAPIYQPVTDWVMATGESYRANEHEILLIRKGIPEYVHVDFVYEPIKNTDGDVDAIFIVAIEVTEKVNARKIVEHTSAELAALNEEITASNEELINSNEELAASYDELAVTNDSLFEIQNRLQLSFDNIKASEERFKNIIKQAPVAIAIFKGPQFIIDVYNDKVLEYWGRTAAQVQDVPLFTALPESSGQGLEELLTNVLTTGQRFIANELPVNVFKEGKLQTTIINFIYDPLRDTTGEITGIIVICNEVTDQVNARKHLERVYEQAQLSKDAAQLGTFDMDLEAGTMEWDKRCRTLFGIDHNDTVTYEKDFLTGLHPDDRDRVIKVIADVFDKFVDNGNYDVEYRTVGVTDHRLRWVRAKGKAYFDHNNRPVRFIGSVLDITEQKQDEQRKNDFIGMVSHELKTPLTSLNAYLQMLQSKAVKAQDSFTSGALDKSIRQIKKMTTMINGFLNVARLEAGKISIDKQTFDMALLVKEIEEEINITITSHNIVFAPVEKTMVNADMDKIGQVINNLISNAVKYSPPGTTINVACVTINNNALVSVKDQGLGIAQQDIDKLFERYYRVEGKQTQTISGFGIGLYLCAEIIERHGGQIGVESEVNKGSNFWFTLPAEV